MKHKNKVFKKNLMIFTFKRSIRCLLILVIANVPNVQADVTGTIRFRFPSSSETHLRKQSGLNTLGTENEFRQLQKIDDEADERADDGTDDKVDDRADDQLANEPTDDMMDFWIDLFTPCQKE